MHMQIERLTTLAFSMYCNKGSFALLLGSGISRSAGIPSGWEVENELIRQLAAAKEVKGIENWHEWYKQEYGVDATYTSLLGQLIKTSTERLQLMRSYFEPTEQDNQIGNKKPTKAHKAIAKLAKKGYIRVIITTNFDRLCEQSFDEEEVHYQTIYNENDIAGITPLVHTRDVVLLKINGDYKDCRFRNTSDELSDYPATLKKYITRILEDFGLVTCGWSAKWDKGLVDIINESPVSRYNSFFTYVNKVEAEMSALAGNRKGETMCINDADTFFTELYEQITALELNDINRNLTDDLMKKRITTYLTSEEHNIEYSELIQSMRDTTYKIISEKAHYNFTLTPETFSAYLDTHYKAATPLMDAVIQTVHYGKSFHVLAFKDVLAKLCLCLFKNGEEINRETENLHALAGVFLFNTIGLACIKFSRFKELDEIMVSDVPSGNFKGLMSSSILKLLGKQLFDSEKLKILLGQSYYFPESMMLKKKLEPHFISSFLNFSEYENYYYIWEQMKSLLFGYHKCFTLQGLMDFPVGNFLRQREEYSYRDYGEQPYTKFFNEADQLKDNWGPIKQGMFGGSYEAYKQIVAQAEDYYKKVRQE